MKVFTCLGLVLVLSMGWVVAQGSVQVPSRHHVEVSEETAGQLVVKTPAPQVWYLLSRSNLNFRSESQPPKFIPRITQATAQAPF